MTIFDIDRTLFDTDAKVRVVKDGEIVKTIDKILKARNFKKYAKMKPKSLKDIKMADNWARLKTTNMCVR